MLSGAVMTIALSACGGQSLVVGDESGGLGGQASGGQVSVSQGGAASASGGAPAQGGGAASACPLCTRHSSTLSRLCDKGTDQSASATIGPAGGELSLRGTPSTFSVPLRLTFPPNAVSEDTEITITELSAPTPESLLDFSPIYEISPLGLKFTAAVEVRVPWAYPYPDGLIALKPRILWASEVDGSYAELPEDYQNAGFNDATLPETGYLLTGYPKGPAHEGCP
jgi:hypothetical protein